MKNNKKLINQFSIIGFGTIISLLLGALNTPIITRIVSPDDFGQYALFQTYGNLIISFLYLGLDQGLVRFFYVEDSLEYRSTLLFKTIRIPIIIVLLFSVLSITLFKFGNTNLNNNTILFLIAYVFIFLIKRFSDLIVRLQFHSKLYSLNSIINRLIFLVLSISLLLFSQLSDVNSLIIATLIAGLIVVLISIIFERDVWNVYRNYDTKHNIDSKRLVRYSLPFVVSIGITSLFNSNDKLFLDYYTSNEVLGIFSSANSIVALLNIFQTTFSTVWAPAAIEHYSKYPEDKEFHKKGNHNITVVMFTVGLTIMLFKDVFSILLGEQFRSAIFILPGLLIGPIMYTISETTVNGIVFKEKSHMNIIIAIASLIVGVIGNWILIPKFGAIGASLSTGFSYIIFFTLRTLISNYYYYINFSLSKFYVLTISSYLYAVYNSFFMFNIGSIIGYLICMGLLIILYFDTVKKLMLIGIKLTKDYLIKI